jgi:alpha-glucosidase
MKNWWEEAIVYQIYPRSYQDANGDGVGDLPGIIERLDYLAWLGITAIWISPCYPSPMADFGYDVSDYTDIHPLFGTLADMDRLIGEAHARNIKIILDFVPNHSSHQHLWFLESRSSRDNPKRDWYIWRDPAPDGPDGVRRPPNNWLNHFGGESAWEWDELTGQYYLHLFLSEQPDLNWRNPEVRAAMLDVMRFWFDRAVDGFRVDVSYKTMKDSAFRDNPPNPEWEPGMDPFWRLIQKFSENQPDNHEFNRWLRGVADEYGDRVLIGEIYLPIPELVTHYGRHDEFHLPFNFHLIHSEWDAAVIRNLIETYEAALPEDAWPNWVLGNHDQHRFATREGVAHARVGMMLLLTLRGTPTIYYGEEIGMEDGDIPLDKLVDPGELNAPGLGLGRDPERTPMQWDDSPNAGFSPPHVSTWLPVTNNYKLVNVAQQQEHPDSMLIFTRRLIALRQQSQALLKGRYRSLEAGEDVLAFVREADSERLVIVLNLGYNPRTWSIPADLVEEVILSTRLDGGAEIADGQLYLRRHEGVILQ